MSRMHTIWIKVQKEHISVYKDKRLYSSCKTIDYAGHLETRDAIIKVVDESIREAAETFDAEN